MGENQTEKRVDIPLGIALTEVMNLATKYKFTLKDMDLLGCRLLAFGEAVSFITEMGMYEEYTKRVMEKIKFFDEALSGGNPFE